MLGLRLCFIYPILWGVIDEINLWVHDTYVIIFNLFMFRFRYRQISNIRRTLVGNIIVDHADVIGASPVIAAPTTFYCRFNTWFQWIGQRQQQNGTRCFGTSPVITAPTTFYCRLNTWLQWIWQRRQQYRTRDIYVLGFGASYIRDLLVYQGIDIDLWLYRDYTCI